MKNYKNKEEEIFTIVVVLIMLFSAMINPVISVLISLVAIIGFAIYKFAKRKKK